MTEKEKEIIKKHYENSYWLDYYLKKFDSVIDIDGKYYWGIDKPSIETSFTVPCTASVPMLPPGKKSGVSV